MRKERGDEDASDLPLFIPLEEEKQKNTRKERRRIASVFSRQSVLSLRPVRLDCISELTRSFQQLPARRSSVSNKQTKPLQISLRFFHDYIHM